MPYDPQEEGCSAVSVVNVGALLGQRLHSGGHTLAPIAALLGMAPTYIRFVYLGRLFIWLHIEKSFGVG